MWVKLRCRCFYARIRIYKIYRTNNFDNLILSYYKAKLAGSPSALITQVHYITSQDSACYHINYTISIQYNGMRVVCYNFDNSFMTLYIIISVLLLCKSRARVFDRSFNVTDRYVNSDSDIGYKIIILFLFYPKLFQIIQCMQKRETFTFLVRLHLIYFVGIVRFLSSI